MTASLASSRIFPRQSVRVIEISNIPYDPRALRDSAVSLDSAGLSPWDRWSYHPAAPSLILRCDARTLVTTLRSASGELKRWTDPRAALAWLGAQCTQLPLPGLPFKSGWIGYLSYDLGRLFETLPARASDDLHLPLFCFTYHHRVMASDHASGTAFDCHGPPARDLLHFPATYAVSAGAPRSDFTRAAYESAVARAIEYVAAGDIFQVNLSQRFIAGLPASPRQLYETLHRQFPSRFGAYLDYGDHALLCNSPELFLRVTPSDGVRQVITRPIKGTRPRSPGMAETLLHSAKDQAELNMIIDLERNDLGRICQIGSIRVTEPRAIEPHPTLYHGAATIEGTLRDDVAFVDLLRATFPGGSITGAPKIRAMEIIEELEPVRRGPYCGAIGYLSADGHLQFNVAIRTMIAVRDRVYFSVGGGIVADSVPAAEYEETIVKAQAMFRALSPRRPVR